MARVLGDDELRARLGKGALDRAAQLSWTAAATAFMRVVADEVSKVLDVATLLPATDLVAEPGSCVVVRGPNGSRNHRAQRPGARSRDAVRGCGRRPRGVVPGGAAQPPRNRWPRRQDLPSTPVNALSVNPSRAAEIPDGDNNRVVNGVVLAVH